MSKNADNQPPTDVDRRRFISAAIIGASAIAQNSYASCLTHLDYVRVSDETVPKLASASGQAEFGEKISAETILLPTPTEALIDFLRDIYRIQFNILKEYYVIIARIARRQSDRYMDLKRTVIEFQRLAPQFRRNNDIARLKDFTEIGLAGALYLKTSATSNIPRRNSETKILDITSKNLSELAETIGERPEAVTLSPAAVEKLREIIKRIMELDTPNENLKTASDALSAATGKLNPEILLIEGHLLRALKLLADAESQEFKIFTENASASDRSSVRALRTQAVTEIRAAATKIKSLQVYVPPVELQQLAQGDEAGSPASAPNSSGPSTVDVVGDLTNGCASWIAKRYSLNALQNGHESDNAAHFVPVGSMQFESWIRLWRDIGQILRSVVPQASTPRIRSLYWRKLCMTIYGPSTQEAILYNLLPDLPQVSEHNLYQNDGARRKAAQLLALL